mmetsp:Transcript_6869/g.13520  ORF Transcript_6869/g.13520 Transcript_6869/m.13520 type:complete len:115 (+) Transcript_6869:1518-1862(+)
MCQARRLAVPFPAIGSGLSSPLSFLLLALFLFFLLLFLLEFVVEFADVRWGWLHDHCVCVGREGRKEVTEGREKIHLTVCGVLRKKENRIEQRTRKLNARKEQWFAQKQKEERK